ncbi:Stp1/IreP family PP2C-type Ser/Thr phosphatase [Hominifimenecus sp. rT4P-3]|uniref:Stp1/IreP family PP2C-type Ser/Thr phosphatase n=1 Tax=Hominifimenecus sp. rT4P-3 TaxID=3242979 RepID=UPI003DA65E3A
MNVFARTDIGLVRKENEDYIFASREPVGPLKNLFMVADGMGGHRGGEFASRCVVEQMIRHIRESRKANPVSVLNDAIQEANQVLRNKAFENPELWEMGTTLVAATIDGATMFVANIGDSRLYLLEEGRHLRQVTRDHSWVEEMVADGKMQRDSESYWEKKNIITRAVGIDKTVTADFFEIDLNPGERILLCSDGLTNMVEDDEIERTLSRPEPLEELGTELVEEGKNNGGRDNISVILVEPDLDEVNIC